MIKKNRSMGWIQNPSNVEHLKAVLGLFVPESAAFKKLCSQTLPLLAANNLLAGGKDLEAALAEMEHGQKNIAYDLLKGRGAGSGSRKNAPCSGLAQAVITGQRTIELGINGETVKIKKPYTDDWTADGFLRWAIALGFLDYDEATDACAITEAGKNFVNAEDGQSILTTAFLSYPPVIRVLEILKDGNCLTKFEIGAALGFEGEDGFTSIPLNLWLAEYASLSDEAARQNFKQNVEGSSDKYARMICKWLENMGWLKSTRKRVDALCELACWRITPAGMRSLKLSAGFSSNKKIPKIVYYGMLATKAADAEFLRRRRAEIILYVAGKQRSLSEIAAKLARQGVKASEKTILADLRGFKRIGLNVVEKNGHWIIQDKISRLSIPQQEDLPQKSNITEIKDRIRDKLTTLNQKYLALIDFAFSGTEKARDFELQTADLFINELNFCGKCLGYSSRPDNIVWHGQQGVIIDNKAYGSGFNIGGAYVRQMIDYIEDNARRDPVRNASQWWNEFDDSVKTFYFLFISSFFVGDFQKQLAKIAYNTKIAGAAISAENLLYLADHIKSGKLEHEQVFALFNNDEITSL